MNAPNGWLFASVNDEETAANKSEKKKKRKNDKNSNADTKSISKKG